MKEKNYRNIKEQAEGAPIMRNDLGIPYDHKSSIHEVFFFSVHELYKLQMGVREFQPETYRTQTFNLSH